MNNQLNRKKVITLNEKNNNNKVQEIKDAFILPKKPTFHANKEKHAIEHLPISIMELFINSQCEIFVKYENKKIFLKAEKLKNILNNFAVVWKFENSNIKMSKEFIDAVIILNIGKNISLSSVISSVNCDIIDEETIYKYEISDIYDNNEPKPRIKK